MLPFFYYKHRARTKMAGKFNLTAQLQLQAPTNVRQVANQIQAQLSNVVISPKFNTQSLANYQKQLTNVANSAANVGKNLNTASRSANSLGAALGAAARRFASITLATGFFLGLVRGISDAVGRAVEFERELLKISQVTGKTTGQLRGLTKEVTKLSTGLGVSSSELLNTARTLSQAGFSAQKTKAALEVLARTDLAATFENLKSTTEGAIALLRQFRNEAKAAGGDIKFLEQSLDAINAVSKNFAVEAGDLIAVIRRTGGVFEAAGGKLNELIALFTSVRGTTRETAETIATGFRTIFTRIQRTETVDQLRELGIELRNAKGEFVGPLEAIKRLQLGLAGLSATDFRFQEIIEQLGGFRQVGKVIPLLKQYETTAEALAIANGAMGSTAADAATAQQGLGNAFQKLKEKFDATVRNIADSETFQTLAIGAIKLAESILRVVDALQPLLPLLTALAAFKLGQIAIPAFGKFAGIGGRNQGGRIYGFNKGGFVPGSGSRDTVPAMLTPGEFVIKKSSVNKIGAGKLAAANGYNNGGVVDNEVDIFTITGMGNNAPAMGYTQATSGNRGKQMLSGPIQDSVKAKYGTGIASKFGTKALGAQDKIILNTPFINAPANKSLAQTGDVDFIGRHLKTAVHGMATEVGSKLDMDVPPLLAFNESAAASQALKGIDLNTIAGYMFESITSTLSGSPLGAPGELFDMPHARTHIAKLEKLFGGKGALTGMNQMELKRSLNNDNLRGPQGSLTTKLINSLMTGGNPFGLKVARTAGTPDSMAMNQSTQRSALKGVKASFFGGRIGAYNKGGSVDTVPAMLTPGEYVLNKSAASSIGYTNLNRMNQTGVAHFNKGGAVGGVQFLAGGGMAGVGNAAMMATFMAPMILEFTGLEESTKAVASQFFMLAGVLGMLLVPMGRWLDATLLGVGASLKSAAADETEAIASTAAAGGIPIFTILAVVITVVVAAFEAFKTSLAETTKALAEAQDEMLEGIGKGTGTATDQDVMGNAKDLATSARTQNRVTWANVAEGTARLLVGWTGLTDGIFEFRETLYAEGRKLEESIMVMTKARLASAKILGATAKAQEKIANEDLKGADARAVLNAAAREQISQASNLNAANARLAQLREDAANEENLMENEELKKQIEALESEVNDVAQAFKETRQKLRESIDSTMSDMREGGASFAEIMGSADIQEMLNLMEQAATQAAFQAAQAAGTPITMQEARATGAEARSGTEERLKEEESRRIERIAELQALRAAELEAMMVEKRRTEILNQFNASQLAGSILMEQFASNIEGFSGRVSGANDNLIKLAGTLKDGLNPAGIAAAEKISPAIAGRIKSGLEKNNALEEAFMRLGASGAGEQFSMEQKKDQLKSIGIDLDNANISKAMKAKVLEMLDDGLDPSEIKELVGMFGENVEDQVEILEKLGQQQLLHAKNLEAAAKAEREAYKKINEANRFEVDVRQKGAARLRQATDKEITVAEANAEMRERVNVKTGGFGGVTAGALGNRAAGLVQKRNAFQQARSGGRLDPEADARLANSQNALNDEIGRTKEALKELADQSGLAAAVMGEIEAERGKREAVQQSIKDFTFATNEQRAGITQEFAALTRVLQTGNLNSIPDQMRGAVGKLLDQFKDIEFMPGMTGGDISKRLQVQQMDRQFRMMSGGRQGVPPQLVKAIFESTTKEEKLIEDLKAINAEEQAAAITLRKLEQMEAQMIMEAAQKQILASEALLKWLTANAEGSSEALANGGLVYRAGGGSIFQARGTDTVPAMLTPGEFVVRKSAVDKIGIGALTALNNGNANTVYKAAGGLVSGGDAAAMNIARLMGVTGIQDAFPNADSNMIRKAWKSSDLGMLVGLTGGAGSPFEYVRRYLNTVKQYEFLFKSLGSNGIQLKDDPASINGAVRLQNQLFDLRFGGSGIDGAARLANIPAAGQFNSGAALLHQALSNPALAAEEPIKGQPGAMPRPKGQKLSPTEARKNRAKILKEKREKEKKKNAEYRTNKANKVYRDRLMNTVDDSGLSPNQRIAQRNEARKQATLQRQTRAEGLLTHGFKREINREEEALLREFSLYSQWEKKAENARGQMSSFAQAQANMEARKPQGPIGEEETARRRSATEAKEKEKQLALIAEERQRNIDNNTVDNTYVDAAYAILKDRFGLNPEPSTLTDPSGTSMAVPGAKDIVARQLYNSALSAYSGREGFNISATQGSYTKTGGFQGEFASPIELLLYKMLDNIDLYSPGLLQHTDSVAERYLRHLATNPSGPFEEGLFNYKNNPDGSISPRGEVEKLQVKEDIRRSNFFRFKQRNPGASDDYAWAKTYGLNDMMAGLYDKYGSVFHRIGYPRDQAQDLSREAFKKRGITAPKGFFDVSQMAGVAYMNFWNAQKHHSDQMKQAHQSDIDSTIAANHDAEFRADVANQAAGKSNAEKMSRRDRRETDMWYAWYHSLFGGGSSVPGFARGGSVDSVPAMLTPGEFVMNPSAVKKHGTGFMNAINRGKVPGFARGGSVGGVQYRQNGGMMSGMGSGLMEGISSALSSFEGIANILSSVASVFSDMSISHTVQVDGTLNIPGFSQEAINQIIGVIGNQVVDSVSGKIDIALEQFKNEQNQRSD